MTTTAIARPRLRASSGAWLRQALRALVLLAPLGGELSLRRAPLNGLTVPAIGYLIACLAFAALAPRLCAEPTLAGRPVGARPPLVLALLALVAAGIGIRIAISEPRQWILLPIWLVGIGLWLAAWWSPSRPRALSARAIWPELLILAIAIVARTVDLADLQPIQVDELATMSGSLELMHSVAEPRGFALFAPDRGGFSQLNFAAYLNALFFAVGGINLTTMRLANLPLAVVELVLVYLIGRELFGRRVGLIALLLLTTLTAHLALTRAGASTYLYGSIVWIAVAYGLARGFGRRSVPSFALAGVALSMALFFYWPARAATAFALAALVGAALDPRLRGRYLAHGTLALLGGLVVGAGPMLAAYIKDPGIFTHRANEIGWLLGALDRFRQSGDPGPFLAVVWPVFVRSLLTFNLIGTTTNHYLPGRGLLLALPAAALWAGVGLATIRIGDWRLRLLALWFWGATMALEFMSGGGVIHRAMPVVPAAVLLASVGLAAALAGLESIGRLARRVALPLGAVALIAVSAQEAAFYFRDYALRDLDPYQDRMVRELLASPDGAHYVIAGGPSPTGMELNAIGKPFLWASDLGRRLTGEDLGRIVDQVPDATARSAPVTYLVHGQRLTWLPVISRILPGTSRELRSRNGDLAWVAYTVEPSAIGEHQTISARLTDAAGRAIELSAPAVDLSGDSLAPGLTYPVEVEWRGWVRGARTDSGPVTIASLGSVAPRLRIGDQAIDFGATGSSRTLPPSPRLGRPLQVVARLERPGDSVRLSWDGARLGEMRAFPLGQVVSWPDDRPRLELDWLSEDGARLLRREYDLMLADERLGRRRSGPERILLRWRGQLAIDQPGSYEFELSSDGPVRLSIDDRPVWPPRGPERARPDGPLESRRARLELTPGPHRLEVERAFYEGTSVYLLWRRGDGPQELVPPEAFVPLAWP